jgi:hypothetical protein
VGLENLLSFSGISRCVKSEKFNTSVKKTESV